MPDPSHPFRYSLNASTIRPTPILEQITIAAEAGYHGIELWHDSIDQFILDGGSLRDIHNCLQDSGLTVPTTIYLGDWFDAEDSHLPSVFRECDRRMEQAAFLGAPHVIAGPPGGDANIETGAQRYRELLRRGKEIGTLPAMEFLGFVDRINTIEDALEIMTLTGDEASTTVLDPFHIFRGGGSVASIQKLNAKQIAVCHFNDTPNIPPRSKQHDHHRVMPGDGHLDLGAYIHLLRKIHFDGWLSLELFNESLWAKDPRDVAREGLEKMRAIAES